MPIESNTQYSQVKHKSLLDLDLKIPGFEPKATSQDRMFFTEQLSLLLDTGGELFNSLQALRNQVSNSVMQKVIDDLLLGLEQGKALSAAMESHPELFSKTYRKLVEASEQGGFMPEVLQELFNMDIKREELRSTISSATFYPAFLLCFSFAVVGFVLIVVFPKFADIFASISDELPGTTVFLMAVSDVMREHWQYLLIALGAFVVGLVAALRRPEVKKVMDRAKLRLPLLRGIFQQLYMVQFLRVLSLSLSNGVTLIDALGACREVVNNSYFVNFIKGLEKSVEEGAGLSTAINKSDLVPLLAKHMLQTGEQSGSLPKVTKRMADYYEKGLKKKLETVSKLSEPIMLLIMGVIVGVLVSSLILPIFKMSSTGM